MFFEQQVMDNKTTGQLVIHGQTHGNFHGILVWRLSVKFKRIQKNILNLKKRNSGLQLNLDLKTASYPGVSKKVTWSILNC